LTLLANAFAVLFFLAPNHAAAHQDWVHTKGNQESVKPGAKKKEDSDQSSADDLLKWELDALGKRLRSTKAIGFGDKLSLNSKKCELVDDLTAFHKGQPKLDLNQLHNRYQSLITGILAMLQGQDDELGRYIEKIREPLWELLSDKASFSRMIAGSTRIVSGAGLASRLGLR